MIEKLTPFHVLPCLITNSFIDTSSLIKLLIELIDIN